MEDFDNLHLYERKIIVGVDFGTTYSGLAWAETRRPDHIHVVDDWPANIAVPDGQSSVKVPTEIRYNKAGFEWGFQIPSVVERHQWFKLGLDQKKSHQAPNGPPDHENRDPEQLTRDYLSALKNHLLYMLDQKLGAAFRSVALEFVLTVPAIWSEVAKEKTLRACQSAGFRADVPISLVSEPEAAAMFALHALDPHCLEVGDTFVLCDAGGGTVDLISYTITKPSPKLEIKEAAAGSGALCGSTFLNRRFGEFLTARLGREDGWDGETLAEAMERFDSMLKKQYSPSTYSESCYRIPVSGLANNEELGIKRGRFEMQPSDMQDIFEPVVEHVIELISDQITATNVDVKAVLLVGGFGQSSYLKERIRSALIQRDQKIEVLQPPNAWTAVVRGAVMKGLANHDNKLALVHIGQRAARKHYGLRLRTNYDEDKHAEDTRVWSNFHGAFRAPYMDWFIKRGDPVLESSPVTISFNHNSLVSKGPPKSITSRVWCDNTSVTAPIQPNDNVVILVNLEASLTGVTHKWPIKRGKDGKDYYVLDADVEAVYRSASTEYTLIVAGKRYNTVTAEYV